MDLNLSIKRIPPPTDIIIKYSKLIAECTVVWNPVEVDGLKIFYNVYRSVAYTGIYYKMNNIPLIANKFTDKTLSKNPNITYWYKISCCYQQDGIWIEGKPSAPTQYLIRNTNKWLYKINERNMWILKNDGLLFDFYSRKYDGEKCKCYDENRGQAGYSACPICYGTGFVGGYSPNCQLYIRLNLQESALNQTPTAYSYDEQCSAWTITSIPLHNRDILIHQDGSYYSVTATNTHNVAGYWLHQEIRIKSLDPLDPTVQFNRVILKPAF